MSESETSTDTQPESVVDADSEDQIPDSEPEAVVSAGTVTIEVPVSAVHEGIISELSQAGLDVEAELARRLQPKTENALHEMYQTGRYQQ